MNEFIIKPNLNCLWMAHFLLSKYYRVFYFYFLNQQILIVKSHHLKNATEIFH